MSGTIQKSYPRWLRRISTRITLLEEAKFPLHIVEEAKLLAPDARRMLLHITELRAENLTLRRRRLSDTPLPDPVERDDAEPCNGWHRGHQISTARGESQCFEVCPSCGGTCCDVWNEPAPTRRDPLAGAVFLGLDGIAEP